jgi:hypothetical protein
MEFFNRTHNVLVSDASQREGLDIADPISKEERAIISFYNVLLAIENNSNSLDSLSEAQLNQLELYADKDLGMASNFNNLLVYANKRPEERKLWSPLEIWGSSKSSMQQNNFEVTDIKIKVEDLLSIFPNPSNGELNINYTVENESDALNITIHNMLGREVFQRSLIDHHGSIKIEINNLSNGVYVVSLKNNERNLETKKLVIQH